MVAANQIPPVTHDVSANKLQEMATMTKKERQDMLLNKLHLSGLDTWSPEVAEKACSLLAEYHIFSLEKHELGHTKAVKHKIVLQNPDTPQVDKVQENLKLMLNVTGCRTLINGGYELEMYSPCLSVQVVAMCTIPK